MLFIGDAVRALLKSSNVAVKMMKIGIYNRWLDTLGGGERYSLTMASVLARSHEVDYLAPVIPSTDEIERRLGLCVEGVKFVHTPTLVSDLSQTSSRYEMFINASQNSKVLAGADVNIMLVFFPTCISQSPFMRFLQKFLLLDVWLDGGSLTPTRLWLIENSGVITITAPSVYIHQLPLRIFVRAKQKDAWLHVERKAFRISTCGTTIHHSVSVSDGSAAIHLRTDAPLIVEAIHIPKWQRRLVGLVSRVPWIAERVAHNSPLPVGWLREEMASGTLESYDDFWTISRYSQEWLWKWWRKHSQILYPPVSVENFRPGIKRKWILNVGRFFAGSHNKKQIEMIATFRQLLQQGLEGWELHLAGGVSRKSIHQEYFARVQEAAEGLPVILHPDLPFSDLKQLYANSAIYWHATGLDENKYLCPERLEHFGIVVVEAMAAGSVPVVYNQGGPAEIVEHGQSGLLWNNRVEWMEQTLSLAHDCETRGRLSVGAIGRSRVFNEIAFTDRLNSLVAGWE
jgi:glycosyltransferase involved in cell wall biosynthesis